jgi:hypothetical protein
VKPPPPCAKAGWPETAAAIAKVENANVKLKHRCRCENIGHPFL